MNHKKSNCADRLIARLESTIAQSVGHMAQGLLAMKEIVGSGVIIQGCDRHGAVENGVVFSGESRKTYDVVE